MVSLRKRRKNIFFGGVKLKKISNFNKIGLDFEDDLYRMEKNFFGEVFQKYFWSGRKKA
jgi:hypothetical protein